MQIREDQTLAAIQQSFHEKFPYLKIEFYALGHAPGEGTAKQAQLDGQLRLSEVRSIHEEGELSIHGNLKVRTLEQNFKEQYGLNAQVFRKSGNLWLQTSSTDDWTLHEQNRKGQASEQHFNEKYDS